MKRNSLTLGVILSTLLLGSTAPAFAGVSSMINDFFTFREEQRELVTPKKSLPPAYVEVPYYNEAEAEKWSRYYTSAKLEAVNHMDGSSKVMRPRQIRPNIDNQWPGNNTNMPYQIPTSQNPEEKVSGYGVIDRRDRINNADKYRGNIYVGEAGTSPYARHNTGMNLGKKTQVGNPIRSWKDGPKKGDFASARAGDYNYNLHADDGYEMSTNSDYHRLQNRTNQNGKPNNYTVKEDDTLTGISEQDQIYGDWKLWPLIYDANRSQIKDPDLIQPGQDLGIPRDHTDTQRQGARYKALNKMPPHLMNDGQ